MLFHQTDSSLDVDLIRGYLTDDALTVGTFGVLNKEKTIAVNEEQPPFLFWHIDNSPEILQLTSESAVVIYTATARRQGREAFTVTTYGVTKRLESRLNQIYSL